MSTTGNEFEQPGVNSPDRGAAAGAAGTPGSEDPTRDGGVTPEPTSGSHLEAADAGADAAPTTADAPAQDAEPAAAAAAEPSHEAVGIGVMGSADGLDHHGQDEGRDTLTVGEAQRQEGGLGTEQEQRLPAMSQNDASAIDKVSGIAAQTRLDQAGVDLPAADVDELANQIATGDAASPEQA